MKPIVLLLIISIFFTASCRHSVTTSTRYIQPTSADTSLSELQGNYIVTRFANLVSNSDSTAAFDGYVFVFNSDGKVNVKKDNYSTTGSYTKTHTIGNNLELILNFSVTPLNYFNRNWWVKSISDTNVDLADASTSDVLEFSLQ